MQQAELRLTQQMRLLGMPGILDLEAVVTARRTQNKGVQTETKQLKLVNRVGVNVLWEAKSPAYNPFGSPDHLRELAAQLDKLAERLDNMQPQLEALCHAAD